MANIPPTITNAQNWQFFVQSFSQRPLLVADCLYNKENKPSQFSLADNRIRYVWSSQDHNRLQPTDALKKELVNIIDKQKVVNKKCDASYKFCVEKKNEGKNNEMIIVTFGNWESQRHNGYVGGALLFLGGLGAAGGLPFIPVVVGIGMGGKMLMDATSKKNYAFNSQVSLQQAVNGGVIKFLTGIFQNDILNAKKLHEDFFLKGVSIVVNDLFACSAEKLLNKQWPTLEDNLLTLVSSCLGFGATQSCTGLISFDKIKSLAYKLITQKGTEGFINGFLNQIINNALKIVNDSTSEEEKNTPQLMENCLISAVMGGLIAAAWATPEARILKEFENSGCEQIWEIATNPKLTADEKKAKIIAILESKNNPVTDQTPTARNNNLTANQEFNIRIANKWIELGQLVMERKQMIEDLCRKDVDFIQSIENSRWVRFDGGEWNIIVPKLDYCVNFDGILKAIHSHIKNGHKIEFKDSKGNITVYNDLILIDSKISNCGWELHYDISQGTLDSNMISVMIKYYLDHPYYAGLVQIGGQKWFYDKEGGFYYQHESHKSKGSKRDPTVTTGKDAFLAYCEKMHEKGDDIYFFYHHDLVGSTTTLKGKGT